MNRTLAYHVQMETQKLISQVEQLLRAIDIAKAQGVVTPSVHTLPLDIAAQQTREALREIGA